MLSLSISFTSRTPKHGMFEKIHYPKLAGAMQVLRATVARRSSRASFFARSALFNPINPPCPLNSPFTFRVLLRNLSSCQGKSGATQTETNEILETQQLLDHSLKPQDFSDDSESLKSAEADNVLAASEIEGDEDEGDLVAESGEDAPSNPTAELDGDCAIDMSNVPEDLKSQDKNPPLKQLGAFQHLPMVLCPSELLGAALKKARNVGPTRGIGNIAKRERNKGAKQLDSLTKELALPLRKYIEKFPRKQHLHAYEYALIDLTFGTGKYEEVLENVNMFRKKILDVGKNYASLCAKSTSKRGAEEVLKEGFAKLEEHYRKHGGVIEELMNVAKTLRAMPVFNLKMPTLCLVGAPNVGKSSLVRVLSTGKPEVCNYPFTTRGISMGHIFVHTDVYQVTDTPGLLRRPDEDRNNIEKLTLAALSYLPTAVLYVHDLTGECGVKVSDQLLLYKEIKEKYHERPWVNVVSKADLLPQSSCTLADLPSNSLEFYNAFGPEGSLHVSVQTGMGVNELKQRILSLLSEIIVEQGNSPAEFLK